MLVKPSGRQDEVRHDEDRDLARLLIDLSNVDEVVRRRAARALRDVPTAVSAICRQLAVETDAGVRSVLLTSLIRLKSEEVAGFLTSLLRSEDVALRNDVIEALQSMPEEALPSLNGLLDDSDSDVRIFAVNIITGFSQQWVRLLLTHVLRQESHVNVCLAAVDGLAEFEDESLIEPLVAFGARFAHVPIAQFAVDASIRRIKGTR